MKLLAVDYGTVRVGLAISDADGSIAMPLDQFRRSTDRQAAEHVAQVARQHEVSRIVVGLPLHMDGRAGPEAERAEHFADLLRELAGCEVVCADERLSTAEAESALGDAFKGKKRGNRLDAVAAQKILQRYIDSEAGA